MSNGLGQAGIIRGRHDDVGGHNSAAPKADPGLSLGATTFPIFLAVVRVAILAPRPVGGRWLGGRTVDAQRL